MKQNKSKVAYFNGHSWYHRTRTLLPDGKVKYGRVGGFNNSAEAEKSYYENLKQFEKEKDNFFNENNLEEINLIKYLKHWIENIYKERVETTTAMIGSYVIYDIIIPNIDYDIKLKMVSENYINDLLEKVKPISKSSASQTRAILFIALNDAFKDGYISKNPVKNAKRYNYRKKKITVLSDEETKRLLDVSKNSNWYLEILLALFAGLRKGEIRGLKFSDFDIKNRTVFIKRQIGVEYELSEGEFNINSYSDIERFPKTEKGVRKISIPDIVIKELKKRRKMILILKKQKSFIDNDYISVQKNGKPRSVNSFNTYLNRICSVNGIRKVSPHGLRHMFATILIENGVNISTVSAMLGHKSIRVTFDIYVDVINENTKISNFINDNYNNGELRRWKKQ